MNWSWGKNPTTFVRTFEYFKIHPCQEHFIVCTKCDQDQWLEKSQCEELEERRATFEVSRINFCLFLGRLNATQKPDKPGATQEQAALTYRTKNEVGINAR